MNTTIQEIGQGYEAMAAITGYADSTLAQYASSGKIPPKVFHAKPGKGKSVLFYIAKAREWAEWHRPEKTATT